MNTEQDLLEKWRELPLDKQQEVLQFVESLNEQKQSKQTELGQRLRQIRNKIIASGVPLLNREEIEKELVSRRGSLQNIDK
ncbi:DUF2281 domain-containing protein [Myxosarcina sp. GI1]|uniref:DUF2281 domain-containing protein n=1 Tax=Myxosarcina sp. GI1 TaxID=1541065 RepID=UPI0005647F4D|nr:DUF2281 domain-containing protein [Myxosarcina sp. GI1]